MKINRSILFIIFCAVALTGCRLEGNVSEDGVGIANVLVKLSDPVTGMSMKGYTDVNGNYSVGSTAGTVLSCLVEPICEDGTSYTVSFSKSNNPTLCTSQINAFFDGLTDKPTYEGWITISGNKDCP